MIHHHDAQRKRSRLVVLLMVMELMLLAVAYFLKVKAENSGWMLYQRQIRENAGWQSPPIQLAKPWIQEPLDEVSLWTDETKHFQFDELGVREMEAYLPSTGYMISMEREGYTVAMFHQIKCLAVIQESVARRMGRGRSIEEDEDDENDGILALAQGCTRYLWNMGLCGADTRLESVWHPSNVTNLAASPQAYRCRDWRALYRAVERV